MLKVRAGRAARTEGTSSQLRLRCFGHSEIFGQKGGNRESEVTGRP